MHYYILKTTYIAI